MPRALALALALLTLLPLAPLAPAANPLDDDAGTGGDAGDSAADATPIAPGRHGGRLNRAGDPEDHYAFVVEAGQVVEARLGNAAMHLRDAHGVLIDADGAAVATLSSGTTRVHVSAGGAWQVAVRLAAPDAARANEAAATYVLHLALVDVPRNDAGSGRDAGFDRATALPVGFGTWPGDLSRDDNADWYRVPLTPGVRFAVTLRHPPGTSFELGLRNESSREIARAPWPVGDESALVGVVPHSPSLYVVVSVWPGHPGGPYTLTIREDDPARGGPLPAVVKIADGLGASLTVSLGGSVEAVSGGVWHVTRDGAVLTDRAFKAGAGFARDADGNYYTGRSGQWQDHTVQVRPDGTEMAMGLRRGALAFGPDGLYQSPDRRLFRVQCDRSMNVIASPGRFADIAFAPDGTLYGALLGAPRVLAVDTTTGAVRTVIEDAAASALAFDAAGRGYFIERNLQRIERFDPASGERQVLAYGVTAGDLSFAGSDLIATSPGGSSISWLKDGVGYVPVDTSGFAGFAPSCALPPLGDLEGAVSVVAGRPVEGLPTRAQVHVDVRNSGSGAVPGPVRLLVWRVCETNDRECNSRRHLGSLSMEGVFEPGSTRRLTFEWDTTAVVGEETIVASINPGPGWAVESSYANNLPEWRGRTKGVA